MFYQLGVKYLKFELRHLITFTNFNIIPVTDKKPNIYKKISESVQDFKENDSEFFKNIRKYNSKLMYKKILNKNTLTIENLYDCDVWSVVYKNIHDSNSSNLRSFLYKFLFNALPFENRLITK
jgi:hypothetical protein